MEWLYSIATGGGLTLLAWILLELRALRDELTKYTNRYDEKFNRIDLQLNRIVSDIESEKENRKTHNQETDRRLRAGSL